MRPGVGEVVACVGTAAANWNGLMPPSPPAEDFNSSAVKIPDSERYGEFEVITLLWYRPLSTGTGGLFQPTPKVVSASLADLEPTLELVARPGTPSTQLSKLTPKESQEVVTRLRQTQFGPPVTVEPQLEELYDTGLDAVEVLPHIDTPHNPPPQAPQEKRKELKGFRIPKLRELLGLVR